MDGHAVGRIAAVLLLAAVLASFLPASLPVRALGVYPYVSGMSKGTATSATSFVLVVPASTVDVLYLLCIMHQGGPTWTFPSGWSTVLDVPNTGGLICVSAFTKTAGSITATTGGATAIAYTAYTITGALTFEYGTATGTSATPAPPALTTAFSDARLWVVVAGHYAVTLNTYPSGFTLNQETINLGATSTISIAAKQATAVSETPGTFGVSGSTGWETFTFSFAPSISTPKLAVNILANPDEGQQPLAVQFYSNVTGGTPPYTYFWVFGDGSVSTSASPTHTFNLNGTYTIELTVKDNATIKDLVTDSYSVHVRAPAAVDFTPLWIILALLVLAFAAFLVIAWYDDSVAWFMPAGIVAQLMAFEGWTITANLYVALSLSVVGIVTLLVPVGHALRGRPS